MSDRNEEFGGGVLWALWGFSAPPGFFKSGGFAIFSGSFGEGLSFGAFGEPLFFRRIRVLTSIG